MEQQGWLPLGELQIGKHLLAEDGAVRILATRVLTSGETVYNLEIFGHHVYRVTERGVLVHNSNSYQLGKSLAGGDWKLADEIRKRGYSAGHIVPARGFKRSRQDVMDAIADARQALKQAKIDINDAANGFWTNSSRHLGSHTDEFLLEMGARLRGLTDKGKIQDVLEDLRDQLFGGLY